jgi:hypothetical protein
MSKRAITYAFLALATACALPGYSQSNVGDTTHVAKTAPKSRLSVGGYGEAVMSKNFYSDSYLRYTDPTSTKGQSHGRFDLTQVVILLGY